MSPGVAPSAGWVVGNTSYPGVVGTSTAPAGGVAGFNSGGGVGVYGYASGGAGIFGVSNASYGISGNGPLGGVYATSNSGAGIYALTAGTSATVAAGVFNNQALGNGGNILLGQSANVTKFSVDSRGDVAASGNVTAAGSVTIGTGGTPILEHLSMTFNPSFSALKPSTCTALTFTFPGAIDGDTIALGVPNAMMTIAGIPNYFAWVSAANAITIRACNLDANNPQKTAGSGAIRVDIWKH